MGVGVIGGMGASLDVEDDGGAGISESRFKDDVSSLGVLEDLSRIANDLLVLDLSGGDADFVGKIGED